MIDKKETDSDPSEIQIQKALAEVEKLIDAFNLMITQQKTSGVFDFDPALKAMDDFHLIASSIGNSLLLESSFQFNTLLRREGLRTRMGLRPAERTAQLLAFFFAFCSRLKLTLQALSAHPTVPSDCAQSKAVSESEPESVELSKSRKRRVLVVDDSKTFQVLLKKICQSHPHLEVVGVAGDAVEAEALIVRLNPDVITLDVHMPGMDGFSFLSHLMKTYPMPVVLISSINIGEKGDVITGGDVFDALYQGAIDFIHKSSITPTETSCAIVAERVYKASVSSLGSLMRFYAAAPSLLEDISLDLNKAVAIGVSTGGTRTLIDILRQLPQKIPPILIAQQIVPGFSRLLIQQLNEVYPFIVKEAEHGELVEPMKIFVAPEGYHMSIIPTEKGHRIRLNDGDTARVKPSIDVLFDSMAMCFESNAIGVLLPGSGIEGAQGLLEIRRAGGYTITQDESDSPDPALTQEAVKIGGAIVSVWGDSVSEVLLDALAQGTTTLPEEESLIGTLFEGEGPRILIVDDSPTIRALVRYHMRAMGFSNFSEAKTGFSAWQMLVAGLNENLPYSMVISDQNMPEMLGLELLQKIRSHEKLKSTPFILVTTQSDREHVVRAIQSGIDDFVTKPMSAQALSQKVKAIFSKSKSKETVKGPPNG